MSELNRTGRLVVAVSGASGAIYAQRFLRAAILEFPRIDLMMSRQAFQVAGQELGIGLTRESFSPQAYLGVEAPGLTLLDDKDFFSPPASGSYRHDGMVIIPCSMGTLGRIAHGISDDLVTRAADVTLKERRKLILVPREMPWNTIMLRNATTLSEAGAVILPASPSWYSHPASMEDLADTVVARVLQHVGVQQQIVPEWMV